jgi:hypothetical protein
MEQLGSTSDNGGVEGQDGDESEYRSNGKEVKDDEPTDVEEGSPSNEQDATGSTSITTGNEGTQGK